MYVCMYVCTYVYYNFKYRLVRMANIVIVEFLVL